MTRGRTRWLFGLSALAIAIAGCGAAIRAAIRPEEGFSRERAPAAPDYAKRTSWAAHPSAVDGADQVPQGERDGQTSARADVFFVHPTTYYSGKNWNQPLNDEDANEFVDERVLPNQASVFNGAARVFAPRYRQATLYAFMEDERLRDADAAFELAYGDVARAFDNYLGVENRGRPIIVAAHSQGSFHALRLVRDYFSQKPLRDRLVIAYLIGAAVPLDVFERVLPDIPLCKSATQTSCVVTYNTFEEDAEVHRFERRLPVPYPNGFESIAGRKLACVNPLTWTTDEKRAPSSQHEGAVRFTDDGAQPGVQAAFVSARCRAGLLRINEPPDRRFRFGPGRLGDYHLVDYSLFYMNLRRNVETRVSGFVER